MSADKKGDLISGRYEVLDIFGGPGKSGMGVVYKCFDRWDRRLCVLKSFQDQPVWSPEAAKTFRREAELWIALGHHPHIVAARTIRKPDGRLYLVLEYIEPDDSGRNCLSHYLTGRPLPVDQALTWGIQFCWGMEHAVKHGIRCHRDIKPDNIMIDRERRVKITDFGLAKALDGLTIPAGQVAPAAGLQGLSLVATQDGAMCGSPPWMAPEQFGGARQADVRNDVYSFGVVLYQMLSGGALPFTAETIEEYAFLHRHAPVPPIESPLAPVVERCMAKLPEDRYPDLAALERDLQTYAGVADVHVPEYQDVPETAERLKDLAASYCYMASQEHDKDPREEKEYYEKALAFADRAVKKDPNHLASRINRSLCCLKLNDAEEARDEAQRAIALDGNSALAWNNLACAYRRLQQWAAAFEAARKGVELDPQFLDGWNTLGGLWHGTAKAKSDYQQAVECYRKALQIDPFFCDGYMNLAESYCGVENVQEALRCYERAAEIDPENAEAIERRDAFCAASAGAAAGEADEETKP